MQRAAKVINSTFGGSCVFTAKDGGDTFSCDVYIQKNRQRKDEFGQLVSLETEGKFNKAEFITTDIPRNRDRIVVDETKEIYLVGEMVKESSASWY